MFKTAYLAPEGFETQTKYWLKGALAHHGRLILSKDEAQFCPFAQNTWFNLQTRSFASIGDATKILRGLQRNWQGYSHHLHRRTQLIQDGLPKLSSKALVFPADRPSLPLGSFCLLDKETLLFSQHCSSPFPHGECQFVENKVDPPSRAYLKLWESFTLLGCRPQPGELCLELGASPGGWTWVLAQLGCKIIAADRAPLDSRISKLSNISQLKTDAFSLSPSKVGKVDWLFSDLISYPDKLHNFLRVWLDAKASKNYLVTLKFQGGDHYEVARKMAEIPGSKLFHLSVNKHELTWYYKETDE